MEVYHLPRPRWTQRGRDDVKRERRELGFTEVGPVKVVDVTLALRILEGQQKWRAYCFDVVLTTVLLVLLLIYALWVRDIENGFFVGKSVERQLDRLFDVAETTFDLNTPLNTSREFSVYSNGEYIATVANLDPDTLESIPIQKTSLMYQHCTVPGGVVANVTEANVSGIETGLCLRYNHTKRFETVRNMKDYVTWLWTVMNTSELSVPDLSTQKPVLLGAIRLRQLRSNTPFGLVRQLDDESTEALTCSFGDSVPSSALQHRSVQSMNSFPDPVNPSKIYESPSVPNRASRLGFTYPADGYAFDASRCDPDNLRRSLKSLIEDCNWFSVNYTSTVFLSLTTYDTVSDSYVFVRFSYERFPQGTQVTSKDIRVFRIPGGTSDRAYAWRITLCAFSLAQLVFFLGRASYRIWSSRAFSAGVNRWFVLDVFSLAIIQTAVWLSITNAQRPEVQAVSSPDATAALASCSYTNHVDIFDAISYDEKTEDLLLGISLVLQGLKFFQVCQLSARLSAAYSIINVVGLEILWWFILTACIYFFFAFGANVMFGVFLAQFFTLPASLASTFLIFSKVPKFSFDFDSSYTLLGVDFWTEYERPNLAAMVWDMAEISRTYEINVLFGFAFWLGLLIIVVYWIMRNLLLGAVLSGYEIVKRSIEAEEMDEAERRIVRNARLYLRAQRQRDGPFLQRIVDNLKQLAWRIVNTYKIDRLLMVLKSDPVHKRQGFATEKAILHTFQAVGILSRQVQPSPTLISELNSSGDSGELFVAHFLASFGFVLEAVDEAILLLLEQEMPFALPLSDISDITRAKTIEDAVSLLIDKAAVHFQPFNYCLPFAQELAAVTANPQRRPPLVQRILVIARSIGSSSNGNDDHGGFFDIQLLTRRLCLRLSDAADGAVSRYLDKALSLNSPLPTVFDDCIDLFLDALSSELELYLDAVPDREQIRMWAGKELRKAHRMVQSTGGRVTDIPTWHFAEVFPSRLGAWREHPSPIDIQRCLSHFSERIAHELRPSFVSSATSNNGQGEYGEEEASESSEETEEDDDYRMTADDGGSFTQSLTGGIGGIAQAGSLIAREELNDAMEDNFDPSAQQRWEDAVFTGNFVLTLTIIHAMRSSSLADQFTRELIVLGRAHLDLEKELLQSRLNLDDRVALRKPMAAGAREIKKHGIEPHPKDQTYHVHYVHPETREYKFVGVFNTQEDAELAMMRTIETEEKLAKANARRMGPSSGNYADMHRAHRDDADSWESDDRHYGKLDQEMRQKKRQELAQRHKGDFVDSALEADQGQPGKGENKDFEPPSSDEQDDEESEAESDKEAERLEDDLDGAQRNSTFAKRVSLFGQRVYARTTSGILSVCYSIHHWWNASNENRLHYDITNEVWRDAHDNPVKVITKPAAVAPLAGKRWKKLQEDEPQE